MKNVLNILHSPIFLLGIIFFNTNQISYSEENFPKFLTLPYVKINVGFYNGWYYKNGDAHYGIDYTLDNDVIVAAADGIVERVIVNTERYQRLADAPNPTAAYGTNIIINHANGFKTLYAHLNVVLVKKNQNVKRGQQIGISGNNGFSTEPHLHFEVRGPSFGSPVASAYDIPKYDPYGIYSIDISLYTSNSMNDTMRLWTSNPPSYATSVYKFPNSTAVYLYSNNQYWPILDEETYCLLGFNNGNIAEPEWDFVTELPASDREKYESIIRDSEIIPSDNMVVKIIDQVGPNTITKVRENPDKVYVYEYDAGGRYAFHYVPNESRLTELGKNWGDVVYITQDLFDKHKPYYDIGYDFGIAISGGSIPEPYNLAAEPISDSEIRLTMDAPDIFGDFEIRIFKNGEAQFKFPGISGQSNSAICTNLEPNTNYYFEAQTVIVENGYKYESEKSNTANATTFAPVNTTSSITVSYPNAGTYLEGSKIPITWQCDNVDRVNISFSVDNGDSWTPIVNDYEAYSGRYLWTVPNVNSNTCMVRVSDSDNTSVYTNSAVFSISIIYTISGTVTGPPGVTLELSGGVSGSYVTSQSGLYEFNIPIGGTYTITPSLNGCFFEPPNFTFNNVSSNVTKNFLATPLLTSPNGGESFTAGDIRNITWTASGLTDIKLEFSINNGTTWTAIVPNANATTRAYAWTVPNVNSTQCLVRIKNSSNTTVYDQSNAPFTIIGQTTTVTDKIAFSSDRDNNYEIYCTDIDGSGVSRLTNDSGWDKHPAWSHDGTKIVFSSSRGNRGFNIYIMNSDGSGVTKPYPKI